MQSCKPLDSFPFVRSRDVEEARDALATVYVRPVLTPAPGAEGFNARINVCPLNGFGVAYGSFGTEVSFDFPASGYFSQVFPLRGTGEMICGGAAATLGPGTSALVPADFSHQANYSADYEHLILRISAKALTEKLTALTGATINAPLRIAPLQRPNHPAARMLLQFLPLFVGMLSDSSAPPTDHCVVQAEQLLMTLFLCGHRHNYSHLVQRQAPGAALQQVRHAEEYIEAHAHRGITLEELADATGASAFSLFSGFRKHRGYSPLQFLTQMQSARGPAAEVRSSASRQATSDK